MDRMNADQPWPDVPEIPPAVMEEADFDESFLSRFEPPEDEDIEAEDAKALRNQRLFRWAAQAIAVLISKVPEVEKVAAFGSAAQPAERKASRFQPFRRYGIEVLHTCRDLDLAVWLTRMDRLRDLKRVMSLALEFVQHTPYGGGVAHHQVDVHLFSAETGEYAGRLCIFGQCPKRGKRECRVPNCGSQPFLQRFENYKFRMAQFERTPKVILFDRPAGFRVRFPQIEGAPFTLVEAGSDADGESLC